MKPHPIRSSRICKPLDHQRNRSGPTFVLRALWYFQTMDCKPLDCQTMHTSKLCILSMMIYEYIILETALFPARSIAAAHDHDDPTYDSLAYKDTETPSNSIIIFSSTPLGHHGNRSGPSSLILTSLFACKLQQGTELHSMLLKQITTQHILSG